MMNPIDKCNQQNYSKLLYKIVIQKLLITILVTT